MPFLYVRLKCVAHISGIVTREQDAEKDIGTEQRRSEEEVREKSLMRTLMMYIPGQIFLAGSNKGH